MLPELMLLGFAAWTLVLLLTTVGAYRLSRVFSGRAGMSEFRADQVEGQDWYRRAMRAHANCIENLPVFAVLVFALRVFGIADPAVDALCVIILARGSPSRWFTSASRRRIASCRCASHSSSSSSSASVR